MFVNVPDELPQWASDDAANLRNFLASDTGAKLFLILAYSAPTLLDGEHVNKTLVRSGKVEGFQLALSTMVGLQSNRPPEASGAPEQYPSLDDESQWPAEPSEDKSQPTTP